VGRTGRICRMSEQERPFLFLGGITLWLSVAKPVHMVRNPHLSAMRIQWALI